MRRPSLAASPSEVEQLQFLNAAEDLVFGGIEELQLLYADGDAARPPHACSAGAAAKSC